MDACSVFINLLSRRVSRLIPCNRDEVCDRVECELVPDPFRKRRPQRLNPLAKFNPLRVVLLARICQDFCQEPDENRLSLGVEMSLKPEKTKSEDLAFSNNLRTSMRKHTMVPRTGFEPVLPA